jgi:putative SOS response-associated peptidase YedK
MPVILDKLNENRWISQDTLPDEAFTMLKPCPSEILKAHTISNLVNNKTANRNSPEVIRPFNRANNSLLFQ